MIHQGDRGPNALLDDYAARVRKSGPGVIETTALRMRSVELRDVLAHMATAGTFDYAGLRSHDDFAALDLAPRWTASLGRIVGLQNVFDDDHDVAIRLLTASVGALPQRNRHDYAKTLAELLYFEGRFGEVYTLLQENAELREFDHGYLWGDLHNPFTPSPYADPELWTAIFQSRFQAIGLAAPRLRDTGATPFDRVDCAPERSVHGPLISVVMTSFRPGEALITSLRSIINQTWSDLEIVLVDDCSPAEYDDVLAEAAALDERIHLIRMPVNGGTYLARNAGVAASSGEFITGQDDDDWSHPERLERQVQPLLGQEPPAATRSRSLTVREDLVVQRPGYPATRPNASSLMFRRDLFLDLGGFLPSRRGADSELHQRLEAATGRKVDTLVDPLALVRIRGDSLSRSDFRTGWHHPARRAFRCAFEHWHARAVEEGTSLVASDPLPFEVPSRFAITPTADDPEFDVVLAGDWRRYGGPQKSMLEEIAALRSAGLTVGVLHIEAARFMSRREGNLCAPVQELINNGVVTRLINDEPARARLMVLRYPPILQFPPADALAIRSERLVILANQAPAERDGRDIRYDVRQCADNAERLFGLRGLWVPQGPTVRGAIEHLVPEGELATFDMPGILDVDQWVTERRSFRSDRPVIGRHSRDDTMKWPATAKDVLQVYPSDDAVEVRTMGGTRAVGRIVGTLPINWVNFGKDELSVRDFLNSLDFFVYFQHPAAYDAFGRAVLEALATGCVAVLPEHLRATFGPAAVYARPEDAAAKVHRLYEDPEAYARQSAKAVEVVRRRFSYESYVALVEQLFSTTDIVSEHGGALPVG